MGTMDVATIPLSHAQRGLLSEIAGESTPVRAADAAALVDRVAALVRARALHDRDSRALLERLEALARDLRARPHAPEVRAAVWSAVEGLTHRPWGIAAPGAIDRLVVAGVIADGLAPA